MMDPRGAVGSIFAALSCPVFAPPRGDQGFSGRARAHIPEQRLVIEPNQGR